MRKLYTLISAVIISASLWAQAPQSFSYQAIVRGADNALVSNKQVGMKISLLQGSETGKAVYVETHTPTSNTNGLVSIAIGGGTKDASSSSFASIDWSKGPYFVKTETDASGGTNYSLTTTSQLLSVPYALYAANSQPGPKGDIGAQGPSGKDGVDGKNGLDGKDGLPGPKGDTGEQGPQGLKGDTGLTGAQGPKGDPGNGLTNGTSNGEMLYWNGTSWLSVTAGTEGQSLTFCGGKPTWTVGGVCPGSVSSLDCANATHNGTLTTTIVASGVSSVFEYTGGNGGLYTSQVVSSTGVSGLTATLQAGNFANGAGSLTYTITGTPSTSGTASFALNIGGKTCNLTRTINSVPQNPTSGYGTNITDTEGNSYKTVFIGTQQWMAENLKVSKYSDGTAIPNITDNTQWQNNRTGAWSYYNNDVTNNAKYGKLYNWFAVSKTSNGNKNVCPTGWHVPTDSEWTVLTDYLGSESIAGGKMKEVGTTSWNSPNTDATNVSLFSALPGGNRDVYGNYSAIGHFGDWWSSTEYNTSNAKSPGLKYNNGSVFSGYMFKEVGFNVRCLRD